MSWSKIAKGKPADIAGVIAQAIRSSTAYDPPSAARTRAGELVASGTEKIILAAASDDVRTINENGDVAVESYGHINDDGSLSSNRLSITVLAPVSEKHPVPVPAVTAPGPDAVTSAEVDAILRDAEDVSRTDNLAEQLTGETSSIADDAGIGGQNLVGTDPPASVASETFEATDDHPAGTHATFGGVSPLADDAVGGEVEERLDSGI